MDERSGAVYFKILRAEITVETAGDGSEPEHTIIRIGNSAGIIHRIAFTPDHAFTLSIGEDFHLSPKHYTSKETVITEVNTGFVIVKELLNAHRRCICREIELFYSFTLSRLKHSLDIRISLLVYRANKRCLQLIGHIADGLLHIPHYFNCFTNGYR